MINKIYELGILPVIKIDDAADAPALAKALVDGDLPAAEVTFRTKAAKAAIAAMVKAYPDMLIGAGTVLTTAQVDEAMEAGAKFIVSPGLNPKIVKYCQSKKIPIIPGVCTPSDIEQAIELGLDTVKFFPAEPSGGLNMLKAMAAPYVGMKFMPTGGVDASNIGNYLAFDKVVACGGSWMVPADALAKKDFAKITELTKDAVMKVLGMKFLHLGINSADAAAGHGIAKEFAEFFAYKNVKETPGAIYLDKDIEIVKRMGNGKNGHIGYTVTNIERALAYFKRKGVEPIKETIQLTENGKIRLVYLNLEIAGFAVHIAI